VIKLYLFWACMVIFLSISFHELRSPIWDNVLSALQVLIQIRPRYKDRSSAKKRRAIEEWQNLHNINEFETGIFKKDFRYRQATIFLSLIELKLDFF
jgi:hypothetical protein